MTAMAFECAAAEWEVDQGVARYYDDPLGFAADCIDWRGEGLTAYQQEIIGSLPSASGSRPRAARARQDHADRPSCCCGSR